MARPRKPFIHQGWYCSKINGVRTKLVPVGDGEKAALDRLAELVKKSDAAKAQMRLAEDSPVTVFEAAGLYMQAKEGEELDSLSLRMYQGHLSAVVAEFGNTPVAKMTLKMGEALRKRMFDEGYSPTTIGHRVRIAKSLFRYCVLHAYLDRNPWGQLKEPKAKVRQRTVTDDEFEILLKESAKTKHVAERNGCILKLLRYTGLRPGELRVLTWDMIKFEYNLIVIPPAKHKTGKTARVHKPRTVPILDDAIAVLKVMQERGGDNKFIFQTRRGTGLQSVNLVTWFVKLVRRAKLDGRKIDDVSSETHSSDGSGNL